ncbi:MAG: adenylosuccinate lyase [Thermodesulfobacteriota bacterium]
MIPRYSRRDMARIWEPENRFRKWLDIEVLVCEGWAELGKVPEESLENIKARAAFDIDRIDEIEKETRHDVIAFLTCVAENVGPDSRFIHIGLTSSDILDTSLALLLKETSDLIIDDIKGLMEVIKDRALEHKYTVMIGRSHGIHAEPMTFGWKLALWYDEMKRNLERMKRAREVISYGKISGAVGNYAHIPPVVEEYVCKGLGLKPAPISSQIVQRDHHAEFFTTLALIATTIDKFGVEVRHLQRTEVLEVEESFKKGQKGSSAMPHKRNPVLSENICGLARLMRSYAAASLENMPLWHERDISHSSVERIIAPDATILMDFMLARMAAIVKGLTVYPDNMRKNLERLRGLPFSQRILLELVNKGITREDAYSIVQRCAMRVWEEGIDFKKTLEEERELAGHFSADEIEGFFDPCYYTRSIDEVFKRVFD